MNAVTNLKKIEGEPSLRGAGDTVVPVADRANAAKKRRLPRLVLMLLVPLALAAVGGYLWVTGGRFQETENAYLQQAKISIAAETSGRVILSNVHENLKVEVGQVLFVVDPEPARIALAEADAALGGARLKVGQLRAAYSQALAQKRLSDTEVAFLEDDLERQKTLFAKTFVTRTTLDDAERELAKARDNQASAEQDVTGALAALGGNADFETDQHPSVLAARAARERAAYALVQTNVRAPADGVISHASSFEKGQFVMAGAPLFSLVETGDTWVDANFKETQLTHMRPGQTAEVTFDTFPDQPVEAEIESIGAGTGAEFSLLPAQNATGNWVKVTQRIPVRLKITANTGMALRTGMSATVTVDTKVSRGLPDFATRVAKAAE
jgi:membrane fusion protein, multidrug efflux system